jgi:hypothetical protein
MGGTKQNDIFRIVIYCLSDRTMRNLKLPKQMGYQMSKIEVLFNV